MDFSVFNVWAILVSALLAWLIGAIWYNPKVLGTAWQSELDLSTDELKKGNVAFVFLGSFVLMIVMAIGMSFITNVHAKGISDPVEGAIHGLYVSAFFVSMGMGINYLYQRRSLKLFLIDAVYLTLSLMLMGAIITVWK
ncbi:MAG: DUF1761 domain-containing protein [Bacteroidetes bacterium]|jgi:hypothetical protein|nr:DUF1761 domain-containing protein [Bacteroidota bacterium]